MKLHHSTIRYSASDLVNYLGCKYIIKGGSGAKRFIEVDRKLVERKL